MAEDLVFIEKIRVVDLFDKFFLIQYLDANFVVEQF